MVPLLPLLLLPVVLLLAAADAFPASCSNATCAGFDVQYPFWLNSSGSNNCGYPGLGLACENNATSLILSVQSHRYRVLNIDYVKHTVAVAVSGTDAGVDDYGSGCPRLHWNLTTIDFTVSWLQLTPSDSNVTFLYNCKKNISRSSAAELLGCRGGYDNKRSFVLLDGVTTGTEAYECEEVVVAPVFNAHKAGMMGGAPAGVRRMRELRRMVRLPAQRAGERRIEVHLFLRRRPNLRTLRFTIGRAAPKTILPITCSAYEGPGPFYVLPLYEGPDEDWQKACQKITVPVLKDVLGIYQKNRPEWSSVGYRNALRTGFQLVWEEWRKGSSCDQCEQSSGQCGYNQTGEFVGCLCSDGRSGAKNICRSGSKSRTRAIIKGVVAGGFSFLLIAGIIAFFIIRKRKQNKGVSSSSKLLKYSGSGGTPYSRGGDTESGSVQDPPTHLFSYEELEEATDGFNDNRELGDGGFGTVYKGYLKDGRVVAVKRLYNNSYRRVEQFVNEAAILSRLRHPNLVMFYGCTSSSSRELLLVYEFVANGTVADHLHGHRAPERALSWPLRLNIAVESAAALTYLHAIEQPIVHRDVKTTNILLDADFHVKVADFGLSRLFPLDATHVSTAPQGTPGYVDPEYHQCYQLTDKSDVYSFGVVLVELISSKPAVDITRHRNEINLAGMAINKIQKCQLEELVDLQLGYESDPATKKMMTMVAELAFRCLQQNGEMRPPIKEVLEVLKAIQGECRMEKSGDKDKDLAGPFSPNTVHAPWDSRATTPNTSRD